MTCDVLFCHQSLTEGIFNDIIIGKRGIVMKEFPKRKQIRLKEYDYSQAGYYFITICTKNREPLFWDSVGADTIRP